MRCTLLTAVAVAGLAGSAGAHPHIFVDAKAGFRFDAEGRLAALRITWTYDAFTSLFMLEQLDLDADRDGVLDDADRAAIVAGETDWPEGYDGDVHLDRDARPIAMGRPRDGEAWMADDRVTVVFDLPLAEPLSQPEGVRLRLYDPNYYYAYTMVELEETADPAPCTARLSPYEPDAATQRMQVTLMELGREETPEQADVGAMFADTVTLECG